MGSPRGGKQWKGKRVVVLGLARQGKALARYLTDCGAEVVVNDRKSAEALVEAREELSGLDLEYVFGGHPPELLEHTDLLCLSGGVPADLPLALQARELGIPLANDSQLFIEACQAPIIGVTGSAGKTTTTTLVGRMAAAYYENREGRVWVGGNIGRPLLIDLPDIRAGDLVVMELSSFQLELMTVSPQIAAVLNVTPNHLDRHKTMEIYTEAKARVLEFQRSDDVAVLGHEDPGAWALCARVRGRLISFGWDPPERGEGSYIAGNDIRLRLGGRDFRASPLDVVELRGEHNLLNTVAACALAAAVGIPPEAIEEGVRGFKGVAHRLEFVRRIHGVDWYNDSIATAPERAVASIRAFEEPLVLLAGGRDKDLPWGEFASLVCERVDHLILFGEAAGKIAEAVQVKSKTDRRAVDIQLHPGLQQAVGAAARVAEPGDVVLLAPGGTSFDEFLDFEERGNRFRAWVNSL